MNNQESDKPFMPKQALIPTPELKHPIAAGSHLLDLGCGTGAGTSTFVGAVSKEAACNITIKGLDINPAVLAVYKQKRAEQGWPAEAILGDANKMDMFADDTFTHSLATAMVFVLPDNAVPAIKEMYRTLKPGAAVALNSWAYVPNMHPLRVASRATRPAGFPEIRGRMDQWEDGSFLQSKIEVAGFKTSWVVQREVYAHTTTDIYQQANMLWSFIGGTTASGWIESDEESWNEAIEIIVAELRNADGYLKLEGDKLRLKFVAHVAVAIK